MGSHWRKRNKQKTDNLRGKGGIRHSEINSPKLSSIIKTKYTAQDFNLSLSKFSLEKYDMPFFNNAKHTSSKLQSLLCTKRERKDWSHDLKGL